MGNSSRRGGRRLRLVGGVGKSSAPRPSDWANEPCSLRALAVALEHLVGEGPDPYLLTNELVSWFERQGRAAEILVEVSNGDAGRLRSLMGPPHDDDGPRAIGTALLVAAALEIEGRSGR